MWEEVPVYEITRRATEGTLGEMEQVQNYSLASGAASITDLSEIEKHIVDTGKPAWENIKKEIEDIVAKIGSGTIKVTNAQKGEEWSAESCPHIIIQ